MKQRAKDLAGRLSAFNDTVIGFVENCDAQDWRKVCTSEDWTVGVVARHIGAGHYGIVEMVKMIVNGETLPDLTMDAIVQMANEHAGEHAECTKDEVRTILRENGEILTEYVAGLDDAELDRSGHLAATGGEVTAEQLIEYVIFQSANEHFGSIKAALGS
jgi:hypothetical protein